MIVNNYVNSKLISIKILKILFIKNRNKMILEHKFIKSNNNLKICKNKLKFIKNKHL